jgi:hypothetical protein
MPKVKSLTTGNVLTEFEAAKKFRESPDLPDTYKAMSNANMLRAITRDYGDQYEMVPDDPPARQTNPAAFTRESIGQDIAEGGWGYLRAPAKLGANIVSSVGNQVYQVVSALPDLAKLPIDKSQARMRHQFLTQTRQGLDRNDPNYQAVLAEEAQARKDAAFPTIGEIWDALSADYKQRYGSLDGFSRAIIEDPASVAADIATVATGVGAAARGVQLASKGAAGMKAAQVATQANRMASAVDPFNAVAAAGKSVIPFRKDIARAAYKTALDVGFRDPSRLASVADTGLEHGIVVAKQDESTKMNPLRRLVGDAEVVPSRARAEKRIKELTKQVDDIVANAQQGGASINTQDMVNRIENELVSMRRTMSGRQQSDVIFKNIDRWLEDNNLVGRDAAGNVVRDAQGRPLQYLPMSPEQALDLRRALTADLQQPLNRVAQSSPMSPYEIRSTLRGDEMARRELVGELNKIDPSLAEIGMEQRDLIDIMNSIDTLRGKKSGVVDSRDVYAARGAVSGANTVYNTITLATRLLQLPGVLSTLAIKLHQRGIKPNTRLQNIVRQAGFNLARFNQAAETGEAKNLEALESGQTLPAGKVKIDLLKARENPYGAVTQVPPTQAPPEKPERNPYR